MNNDPANLTADYDAILTRCGLAIRTDRAFVRVSGARRVEMLNGLVTNQLAGLSGAGRHALLLTAKGRVLTDMIVYSRADQLLLDLPRAGLANLLGAFQKYLPPIYAQFEDASASLGVLGLYGPEAPAVVREALASDAPAGHLAIVELDVDGTSVMMARVERLGPGGIELVAEVETITGLQERLHAVVTARGGRAVGDAALDVLRVESGIPAYGVDMDEENLAQETGLEADAISYDKGCYMGQEIVARIHFRGHVNRMLTGLRFDAEPASGAGLFDGVKEVGRVTSAATSPRFGPIGLGYVRRELQPGAALAVGGANGPTALVESLPFGGSGV